MLFVWSFGTRRAEMGHGLGSNKEALLSWNQAVPVCSRPTGTAGWPLPAARPLPSPPSPWPAWWLCHRLPCCNHAWQPLLQRQGGEDAATIHPDCGGAGETPQLGKAPAMPAGGCIKAGEASQQCRLGWRQGPAAASCGVLSVGAGWGGLSTPRASGEPCLCLQPLLPAPGNAAGRAAQGHFPRQSWPCLGSQLTSSFFHPRCSQSKKQFLLQLNLQKAGRALLPTMHPFPAPAWV